MILNCNKPLIAIDSHYQWQELRMGIILTPLLRLILIITSLLQLILNINALGIAIATHSQQPR